MIAARDPDTIPSAPFFDARGFDEPVSSDELDDSVVLPASVSAAVVAAVAAVAVLCAGEVAVAVAVILLNVISMLEVTALEPVAEAAGSVSVRSATFTPAS